MKFIYLQVNSEAKNESPNLVSAMIDPQTAEEDKLEEFSKAWNEMMGQARENLE